MRRPRVLWWRGGFTRPGLNSISQLQVRVSVRPNGEGAEMQPAKYVLERVNDHCTTPRA